MAKDKLKKALESVIYAVDLPDDITATQCKDWHDTNTRLLVAIAEYLLEGDNGKKK